MDKVVHNPLLPEEEETLKRLQNELEGQELVVLIEKIQKQFDLSINQIAVFAGMDESALHKILKGENREFKAENVDRLVDDLQRQKKLKDINEIAIWKRALRVAAYIHFDLYKVIEPRLRKIEDPVKRVESLKEYLSKQYPILAETYDNTSGAFPLFIPFLDVVLQEWNKRWGWIRVPSGYQLNTVTGNQYTIFSTDLFPKKIKELGNELILEDNGFGTYTIKKRVNLQAASVKNKDFLDNDILNLGNIEFRRVTSGKFLMGSTNEDERAFNQEKPQHIVDIPYDYWMARFPITNKLYNDYVKDKDIYHPDSKLEMKKDHPVTWITWTSAMNYCKWLNQLLKNEIPTSLILRLPTEAEWEKAARGIDGREFSWGDEFDENKCNSIEGAVIRGVGDTTPVGLYSPHGDSPYGCADMAGNVLEWTHSLYKTYPFDSNDVYEDEKDTNLERIYRGGSFCYIGKLHSRCASRFKKGIINGWRDQGFRVVLAPPIPK